MHPIVTPRSNRTPAVGSFMKTRHSKLLPTLLLLILPLFVGTVLCLVSCNRPQTQRENVHIDEDGKPIQGEKVYHYDSGKVMLSEEYRNGMLLTSRWMSPDGNVIRVTDWQEGSGVGIFLRQDGTIRVIQTYADGIAEGLTAFLDEHGKLIKLVEFKGGQPVAELPTKEPAGE